MPYLPHMLVVVGGGYADPAFQGEEWVWSLRLDSPFVAGDAYEDFVEAVGLKVTPFMTSGHISSQIKTHYVKANPINEEGKYAFPDKSYQWDFPSTLPGGGGPQMLPPQCSIAVTMHTARQRGIASKGRFFLPGAHLNQLQGNGLLTAAAQTGIRNSTRDLLLSMRTWPVAYNGRPAVCSPGALGGTGEGVSEEITAVSVGSVVDTQRRRRNRLEELRIPRQLDEE
jgi:hypothetical protein